MLGFTVTLLPCILIADPSRVEVSFRNVPGTIFVKDCLLILIMVQLEFRIMYSCTKLQWILILLILY